MGQTFSKTCKIILYMYYIKQNMASVYNLKTRQSELSSANDGTTRLDYEQLTPTRDVAGANFTKGVIRWQWETSGQRWWLPSRSYMRMRVRLSKVSVGGAPPLPLVVADDIAPNMSLCPNLFQNGDFKIAGKSVSKITNYMAQIDAIEKRTNKPQTWLNGAGKTTNWWEPDQLLRKQDVCSDGVNSADGQLNEVTTTRLELGYDAAVQNASNAVQYTFADNKLTFAQNGGGALPDNTLIYNVGDVIRLGVVQGVAGSTGVDFVITAIDSATVLSVSTDNIIAGNIGDLADGRFEFSRVVPSLVNPARNKARKVSEFEMTWQPPFSILKVQHAIPAGKYEMVLNPATLADVKKRAIESLNLDIPAANFDFEVIDLYYYLASIEGPRADNKTYLLDLNETGCQPHKILSNSGQTPFDVSPSTYAISIAFQDDKAGTDTRYSASKFKTANNGELKVNRFFVNYAGQNKPSPDALPQFDVNKDYTTARYLETQIQNGSYWSQGGSESLAEFQDRGQYFYQSWPRDGTDRSTRVNVHYGFNGAVVDTNLLIFDHYKKVAQIQIQDGQVVSVMVEDQ
jgi:hypothetical protein